MTTTTAIVILVRRRILKQFSSVTLPSSHPLSIYRIRASLNDCWRLPASSRMVLTSMAFETGQRVGDYEVVRTLGAGGLGQVYEVRHTISQRREAMKILLPGQIATPELAERFRREIQLLGALNHPHIAGLHNAFYADGQLIMIMELVNGETLRARSARMRMPVPEIIGYARQILSAL